MEILNHIKSISSKPENISRFSSGDTVAVKYKIIEGNKSRTQTFRGVVIKIQGRGHTKTFTVRKISEGLGVERVFPFFSPNIESVKVEKVGKVRRAKLFYLRERSGKSSRIKEKRVSLAEINKAKDTKVEAKKAPKQTKTDSDVSAQGVANMENTLTDSTAKPEEKK